MEGVQVTGGTIIGGWVLVCRGGVGGGGVVMIDSSILTNSGLVINLKSLGK